MPASALRDPGVAVTPGDLEGVSHEGRDMTVRGAVLTAETSWKGALRARRTDT
jgi:hypothetical protein